MGYLLPEERARCNKSRRGEDSQVSSDASPVLERQNWGAAACLRLVRRGGNKEEERACGNQTPQCCCGRAASPASRYAGGKGQLCGTCAECGDEAGTGEAKLCAGCTAQGDARRVHAVGGPSPMSQHKPS